MQQELAKVVVSAAVGAVLAGSGAYISLNAKASRWENDKPFVMEKISETSADVKMLIGEVRELKTLVRGRGR